MNKNILILHFSAFLVSFAPLFAKSINLSADIIIWWRCLISFVFLSSILFITKKYKFSLKYLIWIILSWAFLWLHWWTFFTSIQYSSVSIWVVTLFTFPLMTAILEPFYSKTKISFRQIAGWFWIIAGVYFLVPEFSFENSITKWVFFGILSAFVHTLRYIITKKHLSNIPSMTVLNYQLLFAFIVLSIPILVSFNNFIIPSSKDFIFLILLSIIFTVIAHWLIIYCFKHFSASTVSIVGSMQVVYSTFLAFIILSEVPNISFYIWAFIILTIAMYELLPHTKNNLWKTNI